MKKQIVKTNKLVSRMKRNSKFLPGHTYMFSRTKFCEEIVICGGKHKYLDSIGIKDNHWDWTRDIVGIRFRVNIPSTIAGIETPEGCFQVFSHWCIELVQ